MIDLGGGFPPSSAQIIPVTRVILKQSLSPQVVKLFTAPVDGLYQISGAATVTKAGVGVGSITDLTTFTDEFGNAFSAAGYFVNLISDFSLGAFTPFVDTFQIQGGSDVTVTFTIPDAPCEVTLDYAVTKLG